jgi:subtilase family serine protease
MRSCVRHKKMAASFLMLALSSPLYAGKAVTAPAITRHGISLGHESPSTPLRLSAWLNLHDRAALDARVKEIYTPGSPTYRQWLTDADLKAYLPTAAEAATVRRELEAHHLRIEGVDPYNLSVRFTGTTADVEEALHTQVLSYSVKGELVHASASRPQLAGAAGALLHSVGGLDSLGAKPFLRRALDLSTGKEKQRAAVAASKPTSLPYSNQCFFAPQSYTKSGAIFTSQGFRGVTLTATGLTYGVTLPDSTSQPPACGYAPKDVQDFYGMPASYKLGFSGKGQTIVLVDAYLEPQALTDGNLFNSLSGLPKFTSANYKTYNPGAANQTGYDSQLGWDVETDLDVQWAHAIAPDAHIAVVQAFSQDFEDLQAALLYAVESHLGNVISNSYGNPESYLSPLTADIFNEIAEFASAQGIAVQFSSGDSGDFTAAGDPIAEVSAPADSPYVTAVGGTTIGIDPTDPSQTFTVGWGNNVNVMSTFPVGISVPPTYGAEFYAGSGGGESNYFAKPAYQSTLPGAGRQVPDVSALADPFTGVEIVVSNGAGDQGIEVIGGTSLSSPIFSAMWAIVDQAAGVSLGQAAPYVALAPSPLIRDVVPLTGPANTTATESVGGGAATDYSSDDLSQPLYTTTEYVSTLWVPEEPVSVNLTFGTDSSLTVTQGWDNVTGWGTPDVGAAAGLLGALK